MNIFETLSDYGIVPVIAIDDVKDALPLADALISGGLPVAEITFRTAAARDVIAEIALHRPQVQSWLIRADHARQQLRRSLCRRLKFGV